MTENIKKVRECRRLETDMNVPPVDDNLYVRTLRNGNISYTLRIRQIDSQNSRGQKSNIPHKQTSLPTNCDVITSDISKQSQHSKDITIGNTIRQEHIQIPGPTPRNHRYIRQDKSRSSPLQKYQYNQDISDRNTNIQPQSPSLARDTFHYTKKGKITTCLKT